MQADSLPSEPAEKGRKKPPGLLRLESGTGSVTSVATFGESKSQIQPRFKGRGPQRAGVALWGPPTKDPGEVMRLPFIHSSPAT